MIGKREYLNRDKVETLIVGRADDYTIYLCIYRSSETNEILCLEIAFFLGDMPLATIPFTPDEMFSLKVLLGGIECKHSVFPVELVAMQSQVQMLGVHLN